MVGLIILHTSVRGQENSFREKATYRWFQINRDNLGLSTSGVKIVHAVLDPKDDLAYDRAVRMYWGQDDLLIWERDMLPTLDSVLALYTCPEESCSIDYTLVRCYAMDVRSASGAELTVPSWHGARGSHLLVCVRHLQRMSMMKSELDPFNPSAGVAWNPGDWTHCTNPPLGLTRFRLELQQRLPAEWPPTRWLLLDAMIGNGLARSGVRTHIHGPWAEHRRPLPKEGCVLRTDADKPYLVVPLEAVWGEYRAPILAEFGRSTHRQDFPEVVVS